MIVQHYEYLYTAAVTIDTLDYRRMNDISLLNKFETKNEKLRIFFNLHFGDNLFDSPHGNLQISAIATLSSRVASCYSQLKSAGSQSNRF